jgi:hypothetical protein
MSKCIGIFFFVLFSVNGYAAGLPNWITKYSKLVAYEQLADKMKTDKFYRISESQSKEVTVSPEILGVEVVIFFDDNSGCTGRKLTSTCWKAWPEPEDETLLCNHTLTNCRIN